ncbi:hypothetical protein QT972_16610 [Microcoleus sp. herbarium7]|uniref:hypothetical protein n=1 Tax=Microcoleus sp. herbarium7 TaxID=3055435 RepID=UPI002FD15C26
MLLNRNQDRVLTNDEVKQILLEDAEVEDAEVEALMKRWNNLLLVYQWESNKLIPDHLIKVKAWKDGCLYRLKPACTGSVETLYNTYSTFPHCWLAKKPYKSALEGLSMFDIEELVGKMEAAGSIKTLLDEGFTLNLIILKASVNL